MDIKTLAAARKYVDDTANALGAVKGSPCTITSITEADDGIHIIFSWAGTDGTVATQTAIMPYVAVDKVARESIETLREDMGEAIDTTVRSINGRKPDSKGNVALPLSVTGVPNTGSPNQTFVTDPSGNPVWEDRTHGGKRVTVEWDGTYDKSTDTSGSNINNSTFLNGMQRYWKISDLIPSKEELFSGDAFCATTDGESNVYPEKVWENDGWYGRWELIEKPLETLSVPIIVVITKPGQYMGYNFTETGIHTFAGSYGKKQKFASLTYGWFKKLDRMYIPDGIGGVQPDWNQNDESAPDYVKNRTHYAEPTLVEDVPETTFETEMQNGVGFAIVNTSALPTAQNEGEKRVIVYDGVEYECSLVLNNTTRLFGNIALISAEYQDTGEPFVMSCLQDGTMMVAAKDTEPTSHTIACYKNAETIHPLDPKYLPADITIPSGGSLTLAAGATVNDEAGVLGGSGGVFVVKLTRNEDGTIATDKTYDEACAAFKAGKTVIFDGGDDEEEDTAVVSSLIGRELVATQIIVQDDAWITVATLCFVPSGMKKWTAEIHSAT